MQCNATGVSGAISDVQQNLAGRKVQNGYVVAANVVLGELLRTKRR